MNIVATEVFQRGKTRFNMVGQKLPDQLHITDK